MSGRSQLTEPSGAALTFHIAWSAPGTAPVPMACPNCGADGDKTAVLAAGWAFPGRLPRKITLLRCPACGCRFADDQRPPDYGDADLLEHGRVPFYVQQNAGIGLITRPLARLRLPPGARYLEVGCGFGFGVDFAQRARGWHSTGIDPAPLAGVGGDLLGIDIERRYLEPADAARHACDVIMASETIEHVGSPLGFVRTLQAALRPGGVLVLTTPNADALDASLSRTALIPLLSPGLHLVLQSAESLRLVLAAAGFAHILIEPDGLSLLAYASDAPLELEQDAALCRRRYRDYLSARARQAPTDGPLFFAFAGRALLEAVADGDMTQAAGIWAIVDPVCRRRFGLDLDRLQSLPAHLQGRSLAELDRMLPLNLPGILYSRAMLRLAQGADRAIAGAQFTVAAEVAAVVRRAASAWSLEDGMTENLLWAASAEALLCAVPDAPPDLADRLAALGPAPGGAAGVAQRRQLGERVLVGLVNAGHYRQARSVAATEAADAAAFADAGAGTLSASQRDALYCLAILDLQPDGEPSRARDRLQRLRAEFTDRAVATSAALPDLYWAALRAELQACAMLALPGAAAALREAALQAVGGRPERMPRDLRPPRSAWQRWRLR